MSDKSRRHFDDDAGINLAPIMSILVILIPVLLYSFTFFEVRTQAVSAPRFSDGTPNADKPLALTVVVTARGFEVRHRDGALPTIPTRGGDIDGADGHDYAALYSVLTAIKAQHPGEARIFVGAEEDVPWRVLARTMDAVRVRLKADRYEDHDAWSTATVRIGPGGVPESLFDRVTLIVVE